MTARSRIRTITSSLSFRLAAVFSLAVLLLFSIYAVTSGHFQRQILESLVKASAYRASDFIRQSLLTRMLRNERGDIYAIITTLGEEPGVETIRIYNKDGEIKFSTAEAEIGTTVDLEAEACYACHASEQPLRALPSEERARIYVKGGDHRVLALINPIPNEERCATAACHAHTPDQSVLGVLDVQMSMATADAALAAARRRTLGLAAVLLGLSLVVTAMIVYRAVYLPTRILRSGTEALAAGDLGVEIRLPRRDELGGLARSFNRMARSLQAADAEKRAWSATLEDRVREKTAELEAFTQEMIRVERNASLGRMAATVAHELNNPLSGIVTYAKLVARRLDTVLPPGDDRETLGSHLDLIRAESLRCGNIVRDLLTYARGGAAAFAPLHLHAVVDRALRLVSHHIELGRVETEAQLQLDDDVITGDGDQIEQTLIALIINAVEAMPDGGRLTIGTAPDPASAERVRLTVTDTGVGIPPEIRERVFDPFFSTKHDAKGVGLGLAVVYGIVRRHTGDIAIDSAVSGGTTVTITLPRSPDESLRDRQRAQAFSQMTS